MDGATSSSMDDRTAGGAWPARLDVAQGLSGGLLAVFMWGHMAFVSSILISKDAMWVVTRFFEGYFVFGRAYPWIVSAVAAGVFLLFALHAGLALRKLPHSMAELGSFLAHRRRMQHGDTTLWWVQCVTGLILLVLASQHLWHMFSAPEAIGPYASSDAVWSGGQWPAHAVMLLCVELHATIGLYRLALKWGWPALPRRRLRQLMWTLIVCLLVLGSLTLTTYMRIGAEHADRAGERYQPSWLRETEP